MVSNLYLHWLQAHHKVSGQPSFFAERPSHDIGQVPDVGDALVVYRDDHNAARGLARGTGAGKVVIASLQRTQKVGGAMHNQDRKHHQDTNKPVGPSELTALT